MNHLIAKTRGSKGRYLKILSEQKIFDHPHTLANKYEYDSGTILGDDEWFYINNFSEKLYCIEILKKEFVSSEYTHIKEDDYYNIEYLIAYQHGKYYFQKLSKSQFLVKKYFTISQEPEFYDNKKIIVIEAIPDAIYIKSDDSLYFRNLTHIHNIFRGIEVLYKEATQIETEAFLNQEFISLENDFNAEKVKQSNRKRISIAMEALKKIQKKHQKNMHKYISEYCPELKYDSKKHSFALSNEQDLKSLLYGIDQRFYTTQFGQEKRLANSVISLVTKNS